MKGNPHRKNLQVKQPGIQYEPEGNGWPTPLTDQSNPVTHKFTVGRDYKIEGKPVTNVQSTQVG